MADSLEKIVSIIFEGQDKITGTIDGISRRLSGFGNDITSATEPLANMADKALMLETALAGLAVGGLAVAVTEAGQFNDNFAEISTLITDVPVDRLDEFRQQIKDYGRDASDSYDNLNASVYTAISLGTDYSDSLDLMTKSERLAIGGRADLEAATSLLAGSLNAYGESTDLAEHYSDIFFTTVKDGYTTIPELAQSLSKVTGIAANGKVPMETLAAAIAAVTATGTPTSEAITSIKAALTNIIKPGADASKLAAELGVQFNATALQTRGFEGVLNDVYTATGGSTDQMARLFGSTEALNAVLVLAEDKSGRFKNALDDMADTAGATDAAYAKMADNMALTNQRLINNVTATLIDIGEPLLDEYRDVADGLSDIFKGVSVGIDAGAFDPVFDYLETLGSDLADYVRQVAEVMPEALEGVDFTGLLDSISGLGDGLRGVFEALFGDIDLTTADGLADAMQKIVDGVTALTNVTAGILESWQPFAAAVGAAVETFADSSEGAQEFAGNILGMGQALNTAFSNMGAITGSLDMLSKGIGALAAIKFVGLAGGIGAVTTALAPLAVGGAIGLGVYKLAEYIGDKLTPAIEAMPTTADLTLTLDDGNILELMTGIIRDAEGRVISVPVRADDAGFAADTTNAQVRELLETGASTAEINYAITGDTDELTAYLRDAGILITNEMADTAEKVQTELVNIGGKMVEVEIIPPPAWATQAVQDDIDAKIPSQKEIEITLQGEIDKELALIETQAATVQTALEWTAKLDIAEAEANAKIMVSAFESINNTMNSTGDVLSSVFGMLDQDLSMQGTWAVLDQIKAENELRQKTFELQEKLTESQIRYMDAKTEAINSGEMNITVAGEGLQPHMEAFMWEILSMIQVRANAEAAEFLIGV